MTFPTFVALCLLRAFGAAIGTFAALLLLGVTDVETIQTAVVVAYGVGGVVSVRNLGRLL